MGWIECCKRCRYARITIWGKFQHDAHGSPIPKVKSGGEASVECRCPHSVIEVDIDKGTCSEFIEKEIQK